MPIPDQLKEAWIQIYSRQILDAMARGMTAEDAGTQVRSIFQAEWEYDTVEVREAKAAAMNAAQEIVGRKLSDIAYLTACTLRCGRIAWYEGPSQEAENWNRLCDRLREAQARSEGEIALVDRESSAVLTLVDNPGKSEFKTKGLVIGHVQSGKTGNMAALIAKASSTPFKVFVVLSGLTNILRQQTQVRLDEDIIALAPERWHRLTKADVRLEDGTVVFGEFTPPPGGGLNFGGSQRHLAVMKKNAGVLRRFYQTIRSIPQEILRETPVMIIDDECDQASVNSAALNRAVTRINGLIRDIIRSLPRVAYVGYTATPFANVLINPADSGDLYPRDFIHALEKPAAYFGALELFGRKALEGEAEDIDSGFDMIRLVPEEEAPSLRPSGNKQAFSFEVTPSLDAAVRYFVLAIAAREHRGDGGEHATMLVHTSMLNSVHELCRQAIEPHLRGLAVRLERNDPELLQEMQEQWESESSAVEAARFGNEAIPFSELRNRLAACAKSIRVMVENWSSSDRIDYSSPGQRYLVVGGNVLARGLTLNGLVVSFFMRTSSQYDTLMQMGRWFGYRSGFEELPRIWMEESIRDAFFELAAVEEEIRRDVTTYGRDNVTPEGFAVRIRKIPGLLITSRNRMRHAATVQVGFAGRHLQTIRFFRENHDWLGSNWDAGSLLISASSILTGARTRHAFRATVDQVEQFLGRYQAHPAATGFNKELILDYIRRARSNDAAFESWNVVIVAPADGLPSERPLGPSKVSCVNRSRMKGEGDAFIKALMSKSDLLLDVDATLEIGSETWDEPKTARNTLGMPPLLLLYPISRHSVPKGKSTGDRQPIDSVQDVLGVGVLFPGTVERSSTYVSVVVNPVDAEEEEFQGADALPAEVLADE